ncbi:MAG: VanZ family protein, partial [Bacilli bacterium]
MGDYIEPIKWGVLLFPFIAALFTIPYVLIQYRKYGSIPFLRVLIVYSFILYLICAYFLVILPLPSRETVAALTTPTMQLQPFMFISDFLNNTSLVITEPSTYLKALSEPWFYQVVYNVLLFVPFGLYLRYYFKCSFLKTLVLSFLLSLFFELTQLSGLYGFYERSYRLFDVDDLM